MTVLAWILAVVGAALAWIVVLGSSMSTVPKLRMDGVFLASAAPAAGLALAVMEGARSGWGIGLWIPALLAGSALVYVWLAMFTQPSPPDWVRAARRALRLGGGSRARRTVRLAHADGQLELADLGSHVGPADSDAEERPVAVLGEGSITWNYRLLVKAGRQQVGAVRLAARGVLTALGPRSIVAADDRCFVAICDGVFAISLPDAELLWAKELDVGMLSLYRPIDSGPLVCIGDEGMCGLSLEGDVVWRRAVPYSRFDPGFEGDVVVRRMSDGQRLAFRVADGCPVAAGG